MKLSDLKPAAGSKHRKKIIGRGRGSGHGGSATKGMKGQNARSGRGTRPGFEGGQMPLMRRIPKHGFTNIFKQEYDIINVEVLEKYFEQNGEVNKKILSEKGFINGKLPLKILGDGELKKPLKITADKFSKSASEKISAAGGSAITAGVKKSGGETITEIKKIKKD